MSANVGYSLNARGLPRWVWFVGLGVILALGLVLFFLLMQAADRWERYAGYLPVLFALNLVVALVLVVAILAILWRLGARWRQGKFGSQLLLKLALIFTLVGFLPGLLIYSVSYQFVSRSIEAWFDVKVEGALDAGLNLGRATFDTLAQDLGTKTKGAALQLSEMTDTQAGVALERMRTQLGAQDVVLWTLSGTPLGSAGASRFVINPERPSQTVLRQVRALGLWTNIEGLEENANSARVRALALVPSGRIDNIDEPHVLQVTLELPPTLVNNALLVQQANREYQERALTRTALRQMYIGTLTLSLFLSVFAAVLLAVVLGNQLARPLLLLVSGVRDVAAGDLSPKPVLWGQNELDGLTRAFAEMTRQLADARHTVERSMEQANLARANLQTILDNLTAGVIVLDAQGRIVSCNPGATRILRVPLAAHEGHALADLTGLGDFGQQVTRQFETLAVEHRDTGLDHWQQSFDLPLSMAQPRATPMGEANDTLTLLARGAILPNQAWLLVFDDISEIVSAQRAQAWGEVARRLAHEIKNPLTPIQLSAERLAMKLDSKLADPERAVLNKSVRTIVDQVDAMKRLVNEFRDYARLPQAELSAVDLNALVRDLMQLYLSEHQAAPVKLQLDNAAPAILGDAQQLRQVIHNLLQNALDACEGQAQPEVTLLTQYNPNSQRLRLIVRDTGTGFNEIILKRAFEPYVTTKPKGTGLGLAVVKKIADEHRARLELKNLEVNGQVSGAQVSLSFQTVASPDKG
ncbi:MAG: ATP-binding protein [Alphaproteobacteria bacterium]|nr:ATP-binding protein [Alphaproteobacteria bacterium]MDI9329952.1 ATP-binding protein [Alphaproteobacteria bacterium]